MTPEQIENWRKVLGPIIGRFASEDDIIAMRDNIQTVANALDEELQEVASLPFKEGDTVKVIHRGKATVKEVGRTHSVIRWAWGGNSSVHNSQIEPYSK